MLFAEIPAGREPILRLCIRSQQPRLIDISSGIRRHLATAKERSHRQRSSTKQTCCRSGAQGIGEWCAIK